MHIFNLIRNDKDNDSIDHQIQTTFWILEKSRNCSYKTLSFSFQLNYCKEYQIGSEIQVVGRLTPQTDKHFFGPKRLTVHTVEPIVQRKYSVKYWLEQCIRSSYYLKNLLLEKIWLFLPEPQAGLVAGMVFGGTQQLSEDLEEDLRTTGLTHVVSASGYNVSLVVGLGMLFFKRLPRAIGTIGALSLVLFYALMALVVPPVARAAVMSVLAIMGSRVWFRQYHPGYGLLLVTLGLLAWQPDYLRSLSFWLSVTATAGIVLVLPFFEESSNLLSSGFVGSFREAFFTTLAAQSFTAPLVLAVFGQLSVLSLLTNTLLLWLTPLITFAGLGFMMGSMVLRAIPPLVELWCAITAPFLWLSAQAFLKSVAFFGKWEWGVLNRVIPSWTVAVWWIALLVVIWWSNKRNEARV